MRKIGKRWKRWKYGKRWRNLRRYGKKRKNVDTDSYHRLLPPDTEASPVLHIAPRYRSGHYRRENYSCYSDCYYCFSYWKCDYWTWSCAQRNHRWCHHPVLHRSRLFHRYSPHPHSVPLVHHPALHLARRFPQCRRYPPVPPYLHRSSRSYPRCSH